MSRKPADAKLVLAGEIYTPRKRLRGGGLVFAGGKILGMGSAASAFRTARSLHDRSKPFGLEVLEFPDLAAVPGFVDIHLHGGGGAEIMEGTPAAVERALSAHLKNGTTSVLATVMTAARGDMLQAIAAVGRTAGRLPEILGLHLEGPFLAGRKAGAQPADHIRPFSAPEWRAFVEASGKTIRIATLAPEAAGAPAFLALLRKQGIVAAAGHSQASFDQAREAFRRGLRHGTHLFNAMSGIHHRDPGLAGALLLDDSVSVELIADGFHLHPSILDLVVRLKPPSKIILVSDATRSAGIGVKPLRTKAGRLFGSSMTLARAVANMAAWTKRPLEEILAMATENPARLAGAYPRKGRLGRGADADVVLLDDRLEVRKVFLRGEEIW
ncbi:MAG: N-acetylglucosamine-6-phosphate deacetylase [Candidatus Aminicenantes bacterium]|nr:N-acetylglucosamine-6-phosphate deacetylase [Candidatus Aminicenantes bacterium]